MKKEHETIVAFVPVGTDDIRVMRVTSDEPIAEDRVADMLSIPVDTVRLIDDVLSIDLDEAYYQFEHDLTYRGGDYTLVGQFTYIPVSLVETIGANSAFEQITGYSAIHIVHYSTDELFDSAGFLLEG